MKVNKNSDFNIHKDFKRLFNKKESKELFGHKYINLIILISILFVTFLAIGFANGSLENLRKKMDDPFAQFVDISIPYGQSDTGIISTINKPININNFKYEKAFGYRKDYLNICFGKNSTDGKPAIGRTMDIDNPILKEVLKHGNILKGNEHIDKDAFGIIIRKQMLIDFKYDKDNTLFLRKSVKTSSSDDYEMPIPIIAIVEKLPTKADFIETSFASYQSTINYKQGNAFDPNNFIRELCCFVATDSKEQAKDFRNAINKYYKNHKLEYSQFDPYVADIPDENHDTYKTGFVVNISFIKETTVKQSDEFFNKLIKSVELKGFTNIYKYYNYRSKFSLPEKNSNNTPQYISVQFKTSDSINEFNKFIDEKYHLEIDMAQIKAKENYDFVTGLTRIICLILISFSILSICMFISNVLSRHLNKIKMNIGTFLAFGIDNKLLRKIYMLLIGRFILISLAISFTLAWIFGYLGGITVILKILGLKLDENEKYFNLFDNWTYIAIFALIIISFMVLIRSSNKILKNSPGDLIYNRV